jgi:hypothetical protein
MTYEGHHDVPAGDESQPILRVVLIARIPCVDEIALHHGPLPGVDRESGGLKVAEAARGRSDTLSRAARPCASNSKPASRIHLRRGAPREGALILSSDRIGGMNRKTYVQSATVAQDSSTESAHRGQMPRPDPSRTKVAAVSGA